MKRYVTVAGIFGASKWTNQKSAFGALIVEWDNRLLSNTETQNACLGRVSLIRKPLRYQFMKENQFYPVQGTAGIWIASIQNTSKSPN
jgi:hypothetical protein